MGCGVTTQTRCGQSWVCTHGLIVVAIGLGMVMHYTMVFCTQSLNPTTPNWQDYLHGAMDGHPYMKLPEELADLLSGDLTTMAMQSNKMMVALY